ncbi:MAG TPA: ParA family protein [Gammaproteobacteria bacterium]|nr:ParA family protein [Gammaproteobacteria bacterium]
MRTILVLNPKGGCGKSTLATNLAGYYAREGRQVALADCDPQGSSSDWLQARPEHLPEIECAVAKDGTLRIPNKTEILVMDSPASLHDKKLLKMMGPAQTIIIPVLPSPLDIRAAERFIAELSGMKSRIKGKKKIATVANRVREDTLAAAKLEYYLDKLKLPGGRHLPFMTVLRASQNYIHSAERGMSIFDLAPSRTYYDREQWQPLLDWLNSKRSIS